MKVLLTGVMFLAGAGLVGVAHAYTITCDSADVCAVTCKSGQHAGTMYWNGSRWSDGIRSSTDKDELARQIVAAQGTDCQ